MDSHQPFRTCIACHSKRPKNELLRIVRTPARKLEVDIEQRKAGRGAYLCFAQACFEQAVKRRTVTRHLKVSPPADFLQLLLKNLARQSRTVKPQTY